jgi:AraC-like DNA-binding protein
MKMALSVDITPCSNSIADNHFYGVFHKNEAICLTATTSIKEGILKIKELSLNNNMSHTAREKLRASVHLLMAELYDVLSNNSPSGNDFPKDSTLSREYEIDTYLALNFTSNSSRNDLAEKLHISPRQLHRVMMKSYGKGYREKLLEIRLEIAISFLTSTDRSITEISEKMGYSSVESFSAFIKRATGKSPRQIREGNSK